MIRHWTDAMGDANPVYTDPEAAAASAHGGIVAPPAMIQVWTMPGVNRKAGQTPTPVDDVLATLNEGGYTGVVATNCEQTYHRYIRPGERLVPATRFAGLAGPKRTALGEGYFVTWNVTWYSGDEAVAEMLFRVLKFRPRKKKDPAGEEGPQAGAGRDPQAGAGERAPYPLRPAVNGDTAFFWEGVAQGSSASSGAAAAGAPAPARTDVPVVPLDRPRIRRGERRGRGLQLRRAPQPPVPGRQTPFVVAVVQLPEGVRIVGNVVDCAPSEVGIGMRVRVTYRQMDDELTLPMWAPREA
nr:OB-fold domain-containing protein [Planobispora longispora]